MRRNVKIWFRAYFLGYAYWRLTKDGHTTELLNWKDAASYALFWGGKIWIDYAVEL